MFSNVHSFRLASKLIGSCRFNHQHILNQLNNNHPKNNIPQIIKSRIGENLHRQPNHPLATIKTLIENYCNQYAIQNNQPSFQIFDSESPIVDTKSCFDDILVGPDHVSRKPTDTYYIDENTVLRTHTSAHQCQFIRQGHEAFLCTGDVYRRDEIDATHYPVFHQMEGVRLFDPSIFPSDYTHEQKIKFIEDDLKSILFGLAKHLFGDVDMKWKEDYFPFTKPSYELEIYYNNQWLEVLGCGVIHPQVLINSNETKKLGWAFGLGLERLAMILFQIPDIRLFWSKDLRFINQFIQGKIIKFIPYSKMPFCYKDISFWLPSNEIQNQYQFIYHINDVYEIIRNIAGDQVEKVELFDEFVHPKNGKKSQAYRIYYRSMDRTLTNEEVDEIQEIVRQTLVEKLKVELR